VENVVLNIDVGPTLIAVDPSVVDMSPNWLGVNLLVVAEDTDVIIVLVVPAVLVVVAEVGPTLELIFVVVVGPAVVDTVFVVAGPPMSPLYQAPHKHTHICIHTHTYAHTQTRKHARTCAHTNTHM
jgi:hypothetical protein